MSPYLGYLSIMSDWTILLYIIPCIIIAFWAHGVSNAYILKRYNAFANKKDAFTLNPLKYISIIGIAFFCGIGYGWCKTYNADDRQLTKKQKLLLYASGPLGNLVFALAAALLQCILLIIFLELGWQRYSVPDGILYFFDLLLWVNIIMFFTHIMPIPGFNGYNIIKTLFFEKYYNKKLAKVEENGKWLFAIIALLGGFAYTAEPLAGFIFNILTGCQIWLVDLVTGGLYSGGQWTPKG